MEQQNMAYGNNVDLGNDPVSIARELEAAAGISYKSVTLMTDNQTITADRADIDEDVYILTNASRAPRRARDSGNPTTNSLVDVVGKDKVVMGFLNR